MPIVSRNAHASTPLLATTCVVPLAMLRTLSRGILSSNALLLRGEDLAAQIEHRQRAWNLHSFADFENRKVPVQRT